jgi:hypothetical protein
MCGCCYIFGARHQFFILSLSLSPLAPHWSEALKYLLLSRIRNARLPFAQGPLIKLIIFEKTLPMDFYKHVIDNF